MCQHCDGTGWRTYDRPEQGRNYEFAAKCECNWLFERPDRAPTHTPARPAPPLILIRRTDLCGACATPIPAGECVAWPRVPEGDKHRPVYHQECWRRVG